MPKKKYYHVSLQKDVKPLTKKERKKKKRKEKQEEKRKNPNKGNTKKWIWGIIICILAAIVLTVVLYFFAR